MSSEGTHTALAAGLTHTLAFVVPETKTVPRLYPEAPEFQSMPRVFATGFSAVAHDGVDEISRVEEKARAHQSG